MFAETKSKNVRISIPSRLDQKLKSISEFLSFHYINWYVWQTTRLKIYVTCVLDKDRKSLKP